MAVGMGRHAREWSFVFDLSKDQPPTSWRVPHPLPHGLDHSSQVALLLLGSCDQSCLCPHPLMVWSVILRWESRTVEMLLFTSDSELELGRCRKSSSVQCPVAGATSET